MAIRYHDFDNGLDTNDGSTPALALKNLPGTSLATGNAIYNTNAGDIVYLARGSKWNISAATGNWFFAVGDEGAEGNPVVLDAYDRTGETGAAQPIVSTMAEYASGDWTLSGTTGVWYVSTQATSTLCPRVFFNLVGQKSGATSIATCTATTPWWYDNTAKRVYVYSGSDTIEPSTAHTGVEALVSSVTGNQNRYSLMIQRCSSITARNINFRGGTQAGIGVLNNLNGTATGDIIIEDCLIDYNVTGVDFSTNTGITQPYSGENIIRNNIVDKRWGILENTGGLHNGDGIRIDGGANYNVLIENNTVTDYTHSGINISFIVSDHASRGIRVLDNYITCPVSEYGRGLATSGLNDTLVDTLISGNYIYNTNTRNQIEGTRVYFIGNVIDTIRESIVTANTSQGISSVARINSSVDDVIIANNLIINTFEHPIRIADGITYPIGKYSCYNNICISSGTDECLIYTEVDVLGDIDIQNNVFYNADLAETINWDATVYTLAAAEAALTEMSNNLSTDPLLNNNIPQNNTLYHAGKTVAFNLKDFKGHKFNNPPTIGAYEFTSRSAAKTGRDWR